LESFFLIIYFNGAQFLQDIHPTAKFSATGERRLGAMSGIIYVAAFVAEAPKISFTHDLEKKWGISVKLDGLENEYAVIFCRFASI
jgi:hypothetical protein